LVILAIYGSQFVIDTAVTFIASIPTKIIAWLSNMAGSNIDFVTTMSNVSAGFENVFSVITNLIGIIFFGIYIFCVISLFKGDKIRIPFITDFVKKNLIEEIMDVLEITEPVTSSENISPNTEPETVIPAISNEASEDLNKIFDTPPSYISKENNETSEKKIEEMQNFENAIVDKISELSNITTEETVNTANDDVDEASDEIDKTDATTQIDNVEQLNDKNEKLKAQVNSAEIVKEIVKELGIHNDEIDEFEKHFENDQKTVSKDQNNNKEIDTSTNETTVKDVEEVSEEDAAIEENEANPSPPPIKESSEEKKKKNRRKNRNRFSKKNSKSDNDS
jgi:uncharacterized membrane protein